MRSPITTHILDTARGVPAAGVAATLEWQDSTGNWHQLATGRTDNDGRIGDLLPPDVSLSPGVYRLTFATGEYFAATGIQPAFYPQVRVEFALPDEGARQHYHIPLLLSPYGYSTYRGS